MPAPLAPGDPRRLGDYDLIGRLGEGGQGIVYLGVAPDGTRVAVKNLKGITDPGTRRRLEREFEAVKRVNPFCTAQVLSFHESYIVSEYVDGPSLQERVQGSGPLAGGELVRLAVGTASALAAIHDAGVVHRDFKPANVLLGPDGPRVVDFGIARPVDAGTSTVTFGTPGYVPPELLRGEPISARSDLFAWAATIVFAATGRHPFSADSVALIYQRILHFEPDLSAVPEHLRPMVSACLDKDPAHRPDASSLMIGLVSPRNVAPTLRPAPEPTGPVGAAPPGGQDVRDTPTLGAPLPRPRGGGKAPFVAAAAALALLLAGGVYLLWPDGEDPATKPAAKKSAQPADGLPAARAGLWTGTVVESVSGDDTQIELTLKAGRETGSFHNVGGDCRQPVVFQSAQGDVYTYELQATVAPAPVCVGGTITARFEGSILHYSWRNQPGSPPYAGDLTQ